MLPALFCWTDIIHDRQGYGDRLADSGVTGPRGNYDLHAIGATMEDVGKNVMANMSGSSTACAGFVAGEGITLTKVQCIL